MPLDEIDISEAQLIPMATTLHTLVDTYNQWVQAVNADPSTLAANAPTMHQLLDQIHDLASMAFDNIQAPLNQMIPALGLPADFGWSWELGQLVNACTTARNQVDAELAGQSVAQ